MGTIFDSFVDEGGDLVAKLFVELLGLVVSVTNCLLFHSREALANFLLDNFLDVRFDAAL